MSRGRHALQRSNRVRLKADCHALLGKLLSGNPPMQAEIDEMMVRLKPPTGAAAPIVLTGYTAMDKAGKVKVNTLVPVDPNWKAGAILDSLGNLSGVRYRKI